MGSLVPLGCAVVLMYDVGRSIGHNPVLADRSAICIVRQCRVLKGIIPAPPRIETQFSFYLLSSCLLTLSSFAKAFPPGPIQR